MPDWVFPTSCQKRVLIEPGQPPVVKLQTWNQTSVVLQKKYMGARRSSPCTFAHLQEKEVMKCCPENAVCCRELAVCFLHLSSAIQGDLMFWEVSFSMDVMCWAPLSCPTASLLVPYFQCTLICMQTTVCMCAFVEDIVSSCLDLWVCVLAGSFIISSGVSLCVKWR